MTLSELHWLIQFKVFQSVVTVDISIYYVVDGPWVPFTVAQLTGSDFFCSFGISWLHNMWLWWVPQKWCWHDKRRRRGSSGTEQPDKYHVHPSALDLLRVSQTSQGKQETIYWTEGIRRLKQEHTLHSISDWRSEGSRSSSNEEHVQFNDWRIYYTVIFQIEYICNRTAQLLLRVIIMLMYCVCVIITLMYCVCVRQHIHVCLFLVQVVLCYINHSQYWTWVATLSTKEAKPEFELLK